VTVLEADDSHLAGIAAIYNEAVLNTTAIWNDKQVDVANRAVWMAQRRLAGYPVLVAIDRMGEVVGYASFGDFRAFDGYRFSVEHSVYVRADARRGGVARALMQRLIADGRRVGKHLMIGAIESGNEASIRLHESLGFVVSGRMEQVGTKFGRWLDLTWMQLRLDELPPR
jgi:L-amino acid N-acyltransferase